MKKTDLEINKPFWAIVKSGDVDGYHTGRPHTETALYEFDTATALNDFLGNGSVESGESMGEYMFNILATSHKNLNQLEAYEKEAEEQEQAELKAMGVY